MTGHTASVYSLAFSAESSMLVSGGADWTVRCWDVKSAGGLPAKARENGVNGIPNGVNGTENSSEGGTMANGLSKEQEENAQTSVSFFLLQTMPNRILPELIL